MAQICPHCGSELPEESRFCLSCMQYTVQPEIPKSDEQPTKKKKHPALVSIVAGVILLCAAATMLGSYLKNSEKTQALPSPPESAIIQTTESSLAVPAEAVQQPSETLSGEPSSEEASLAVTQDNPQPSSATQSTSNNRDSGNSASGGSSASGNAEGTGSGGGTTAPTTTQSVTPQTSVVTTEKSITEADQIVITGGVLRHYPATATNQSYEIPYGVTKIADNAFSGNKYITSLTFSDRETLDCNYANLFNSLPNLNTIYIYPGTSPDLDGKQYFWGKVVYL